MKKLVKWFYDNKPILRKSNINYMKTDRKFYNNSVNVRPSINMIKADDLDYRPDKVMLPKVHNVFTPNPSKSSFLDKGTIDEGTLRSKIRSILPSPTAQKNGKDGMICAKILTYINQNESEINSYQDKRRRKFQDAGSVDARKRLLQKMKRNNQIMKRNIDHIIKCEPDALHAMNLYRLLTKNWTEYPNAYKICSKIPKNKQKRLQEILNDNRYCC